MDRQYYFYRCDRCKSLITRLELNEALKYGAVVCTCGSGAIRPTNLVGREWFKLGVLKMVVLQLLGKLDPPPEHNAPITVTAGTPVPALSINERSLGRDDEDAL